jgi:hypothetical protein
MSTGRARIGCRQRWCPPPLPSRLKPLRQPPRRFAGRPRSLHRFKPRAFSGYTHSLRLPARLRGQIPSKLGPLFRPPARPLLLEKAPITKSWWGLRIEMVSSSRCHLRRLGSATEHRRMRASCGRGGTDLRSATLHHHSGIFARRARRFVAQVHVRRVHVVARRTIGRVGLIDNSLLTSTGGRRETGEEQRGYQDDLSLHSHLRRRQSQRF